MAIELKVPSVGESIAEVEIGEWRKAAGDVVQKDETVALLESEKATVELPSPANGVLKEILKKTGETAAIGEVIGLLEPGGEAAQPVTAPSPAPSPLAATAETPVRVMPAAQRALAEQGLRPEEIHASGPGGRMLKEDVLRKVETTATDAEAKTSPTPSAVREEPKPTRLEPEPKQPPASSDPRGEEVVPMTRLRRTVAERLVQAQQNAALLTTFNEIDLSSVMSLRREFGEAFQAKHGARLGFMSFFVRAVCDALKLVPQVNAEIRGKDIVYHKYCDIGIAVGGGKGLVVPVLRNAEKLSFAQIEVAIADFAKRAKENKLAIDELQGGTFTITNGGIYGSLLSTPIINPPQSGVLGMHAIQERPIAREGQVVIRPMMYVALTYDHRLVDGREAVTFLKRVKESIETPARLLLEV